MHAVFWHFLQQHVWLTISDLLLERFLGQEILVPLEWFVGVGIGSLFMLQFLSNE